MRAHPLRRPGPRGLGARVVRPHPGRLRPRVRRHLVGRRDHRPPPRRGRAAVGRPRDGRARRGGGAGGAGAGGLRALRCPLPRERRSRPAAPPGLPGQAHAPVAAAAEGPVAARGGQALRPVPDHPRDLPRVPAGRARPARPGGVAPRAAHAGPLARGGRDPARLSVRVLAALRLRGHLHVRGRHAERGAARRGARPGPRPAPRAARPGGAAGADRPGGARRGGGRPAAPERADAGGELRWHARRAPRAGRPDRGRGRGAQPRRGAGRADAHRAGAPAARRADADRRRGALDRLRGRRALPRRPRRRAPGRASRGVPRGGGGAALPPGPPLRPHPRPLHHPRPRRPLRRGPRSGPARARALGTAGPGRAATGRQRTRVVRHRCAAPSAASVAGHAPQGGGARRAACAGSLPSRLAGRGLGAGVGRRRGSAARAAGAPSGRGPGRAGMGARRAATAHGQLLPRLARPALRGRRDRVGGRRLDRPQQRPGGHVLPRRRPLAGPARR